MRLTHYLTESFKEIPEEEIDSLIDKKCKYAKSILKGKLLFRGMRDKPNTFIQSVRQDRQPMNTSKKTHVQLDEIFQTLFGWKPRSSGLFVTGNQIQADQYGYVFIIWPIGKFKFIYSSLVKDMFMSIHMIKAKKRDRAGEESLEEFIKDNYTDKNIIKAVNEKTEIMIQCKQYYAKRFDWSEMYA